MGCLLLDKHLRSVYSGTFHGFHRAAQPCLAFSADLNTHAASHFPPSHQQEQQPRLSLTPAVLLKIPSMLVVSSELGLIKVGPGLCGLRMISLYSPVSHSRSLPLPSPPPCFNLIFSRHLSLFVSSIHHVHSEFPIIHLSSCVTLSSLLPSWHFRPVFSRKPAASTPFQLQPRIRTYQQGRVWILFGSLRPTTLELLPSHFWRVLLPALLS
jgi:hypothetical protein